MNSRGNAVALCVIASVLVACGTTSAPTADLKQIALQATDLPSGMSRCAESGSLDDYLKAFAGSGSQWRSGLASAWGALQSHGATTAWVESYKVPRASRPCQPLVNEDTDLAATSIVVRFKDDHRPAEAVAQGMYLIVGPTDPHTVATGPNTGLGKNSYLAIRAIYGYIAWYAVWQRGNLAVLFVAENLMDVHRLAFALQSMDARMQGRTPPPTPSVPPALQPLSGAQKASPSPSPPMTTPVSLVGAVGQVNRFPGVDVTVVSVNKNYIGGASARPGRYLVAITILYVSTGDQAFEYNQLNWTIVDQYETAHYAREPLEPAQLAPGARVQFTLTYEVENTATMLAISSAVGANQLRIPMS